MTHYINLLEPSELRYLSPAVANPWVKWLAVAAGVAVLGLVGLYYRGLQSTIQEGDRLSKRWETIKKDVEAATHLNLKVQRLDKGVNSLRGWTLSRPDWTEFLEYTVAQVPVSAEDVQFTRFSFDEVILGLRNQVPGPKPADFHPLKRQLEITLRGVIRSERPERMLTQYQRNLLSGEAPVSAPIAQVNLDAYDSLRDELGALTDRTQFTFTLRLEPRVLLP